MREAKNPFKHAAKGVKNDQVIKARENQRVMRHSNTSRKRVEPEKICVYLRAKGAIVFPVYSSGSKTSLFYSRACIKRKGARGELRMLMWLFSVTLCPSYECKLAISYYTGLRQTDHAITSEFVKSLRMKYLALRQACLKFGVCLSIRMMLFWMVIFRLVPFRTG